MSDLSPGDKVTADDVTPERIQALLDWLDLHDVGGRTWVATWEVRTILAGGAPSCVGVAS